MQSRMLPASTLTQQGFLWRLYFFQKKMHSNRAFGIDYGGSYIRIAKCMCEDLSHDDIQMCPVQGSYTVPNVVQVLYFKNNGNSNNMSNKQQQPYRREFKCGNNIVKNLKNHNNNLNNNSIVASLTCLHIKDMLGRKYSELGSHVIQYYNSSSSNSTAPVSLTHVNNVPYFKLVASDNCLYEFSVSLTDLANAMMAYLCDEFVFKRENDEPKSIIASQAKCTCTCNDYYNDAQRQAIKDMVTQGSNDRVQIIRLLNNSSCSLIGYGMLEDKKQTAERLARASNLLQIEHVAIINWSATNLSFALCEVEDGIIEIKDSVPMQPDSISMDCCGNAIDKLMVNYYMTQLTEQQLQVVNNSKNKHELMIEFEQQCQRAKHTLTTLPQVNLKLMPMNDSNDSQQPQQQQQQIEEFPTVTITRNEFEQVICKQVFNRFKDHLQFFINKQQLDTKFGPTGTLKNSQYYATASANYLQVILVGGSCLIPHVAAIVEAMLPSAVVRNSMDSSTVVAMGAARQACILTNKTYSPVIIGWKTRKYNKRHIVTKTFYSSSEYLNLAW